MGAFIVRRLLNYLILTFIAASAAYLLASIAFHPQELYLQKNPPTPHATMINELNERNSNPWTSVWGRYWHWLDGVFHGDFGKTYDLGSVNQEFGIRVWVTVRLVTISAILSAIAGILVGSFQAVRQYKAADHAITFASYLIFATPVFVLGPFLKLLAVQYNKATNTQTFVYVGETTPGTTGFWNQLVDRADHLLLPSIGLLLINIAFYARFQRNTMLDVIGSDFLRTARAKGLRKGQAIRRHGIRTAVIPVMTLVTFSTITTFSGAVITEKVFSWNGLGAWFADSADKFDINAVAAISIFTAVLVLIAGLLSDIVTAALDPRVRL